MKPTSILMGKMADAHLKEIYQQLFQQQKIIDLKPLEFHEGSIVAQGFTLDENWKPTHIVFRTKHNRRKVKVIDALITSEVAVLYVDKDTRNWPYTKGCKLCCDIQMIYTGDGILSQIKSFSSPQGTIHFQHDPLLDNP